MPPGQGEVLTPSGGSAARAVPGVGGAPGASRLMFTLCCQTDLGSNPVSAPFSYG